MCGIFGIIRFDPSDTVRQSDLVPLNNLIHHRGPDQDGYFTDGPIGLSHKRLSILDLSENGRQPMHFKDRYTIVYNGEVYNFIEIRDTLKAKGYSFRSNTDTEVILAAYDYWQEDCLQHFNGMWAFVIYDRLKQRVFCSRDRFGIKPFYYIQTERELVFSSEIKPLLTFFTERKANMPRVMDFLVLNIDEFHDETFFEGVRKLPASHYLTYDLTSRNVTIEKYYDVRFNADIYNASFEDNLAEFERLFRSSVSLRLRSDVKVGTCLSGGLDSSSVAAMAATFHKEKSDSPFTAITAKSVQTELDESPFAKEVVDFHGLDWGLTHPQVDEFIDILPTVVDAQEDPFLTFSVVFQHFVIKKAKEKGLKVLLDGQGGDELLLGYERFYGAYLKQLPLSQKGNAFRMALQNSRLGFKDLFFQNLYFSCPSLRKHILRRRLPPINNNLFDLMDFDKLSRYATAYQDVFLLQKMELFSFTLNRLLRYEDKNAMHFSLETRVPFVDYRLIDLCLSIRPEHKIRSSWTKYLLRRTADSVLPPSITWRKNKFGFNAPLKSVLAAFQDTLKRDIAQSDLIQSIFKSTAAIQSPPLIEKLYILSVWEKQFNIRQ